MALAQGRLHELQAQVPRPHCCERRQEEGTLTPRPGADLPAPSAPGLEPEPRGEGPDLGALGGRAEPARPSSALTPPAADFSEPPRPTCKVGTAPAPSPRFRGRGEAPRTRTPALVGGRCALCGPPPRGGLLCAPERRGAHPRPPGGPGPRSRRRGVRPGRGPRGRRASTGGPSIPAAAAAARRPLTFRAGGGRPRAGRKCARAPPRPARAHFRDALGAGGPPPPWRGRGGAGGPLESSAGGCGFSANVAARALSVPPCFPRGASAGRPRRWPAC